MRVGSLILLLISLTLSSADAGSALLNWVAPTTNEDDSPLTDLAGYRVYVGLASRTYDPPLEVGLATSASLNELAEGLTYYFAVTAYDDSGNESVYSEERTKTITTSQGDVTPPTVTITDPLDGATVPRRGHVTIQAAAIDDVGVLDVTISVMNGTGLIHQCSDGVPPYTCLWSVPAANRKVYTLLAVASDAAGHTASSTAVQVTAR